MRDCSTIHNTSNTSVVFCTSYEKIARKMTKRRIEGEQIFMLQPRVCKVVGGVAIIKVGSINNRPISWPHCTVRMVLYWKDRAPALETTSLLCFISQLLLGRGGNTLKNSLFSNSIFLIFFLSRWLAKTPGSFLTPKANWSC